MNTKAIEKSWSELRGRIKAKWSVFNDEELENIKGDLSLIAGKIQKSYGISVNQADRQYEEFKQSVHSLIEETTPETAPAGPAVVPVTVAAKPNLVVTSKT